MGTIAEALNRYEEEFAFARRLILPDLEKYRLLTGRQRLGGNRRSVEADGDIQGV